MPRDAPNRRAARRLGLPQGVSATLEIGAAPELRRFRVLNVSAGDLLFLADPGVPAPERGASLANARLRVAGFQLRCHLVVERTSRQLDGAVHCGARLYPASGEEQNTLIGLVAALDGGKLQG